MTPFPLEGGRAGDGGGDLSTSLPIPDRKPHGPVAGGVARARRLRREMTLAERMLWAELRKLNLNIRRQAPIGRYVVDFLSHAAKLVIEIDGPVHEEPERAARDLDRTAWLNGKGYRVIRFAEADVRNRLAEVVERIAAEMSPPPSPTLPPSRGKGG
ncbi:MAG TPA: endonuclease domain-containing protein [Phenylobacterium sp.]|nr:endonuclease domain-containing protein [Phenylobacterium sp.]